MNPQMKVDIDEYTRPIQNALYVTDYILMYGPGSGDWIVMEEIDDDIFVWFGAFRTLDDLVNDDRLYELFDGIPEVTEDDE